MHLDNISPEFILKFYSDSMNKPILGMRFISGGGGVLSPPPKRRFHFVPVDPWPNLTAIFGGWIRLLPPIRQMLPLYSLHLYIHLDILLLFSG